MIRVLVLANQSLLEGFIVSALSQETDLDVVSLSHLELDRADRYSIVIIVDEVEREKEAVDLGDLIRDDITQLIIRVSLTSRNIYVNESYQLINPQMEQMVSLVRDFSREHLTKNVEEDGDTSSQKKMRQTRQVQTQQHNPQQMLDPLGPLFALKQAINFHNRAISNETGPSEKGISMFFYSFFLQYLRLKNPRNVTLPTWQEYSTGND